jgi:hypothetical protein
VGKVLPPADVLVEHYKEAVVAARRTEIERRIWPEVRQRIEQELEQALEGVDFAEPTLPATLAERVHTAFAANPYTNWRAAVAQKATEGLKEGRTRMSDGDDNGA